jgi:hypothetical protein
MSRSLEVYRASWLRILFAKVINMPLKNSIPLSPDEMEEKFAGANMQEVLKGCKQNPHPKDYRNPLKKKREHTITYLDDREEMVAIICYFVGPDGEESRSIRQMVIDGIHYYLDSTKAKA